MYDNDAMFDYFGRAGGGAPLRKANGDLQTTRRTLVNDRFEELSNPMYGGINNGQVYSQNTPNQVQYNNMNNNSNNYYQEMNQYNQQFQTQNQQIIQQQQQMANQYNQLPMQMNQNAYNQIPNGMYMPNVVQASYLQAPIYTQMSQTSYNQGMNRNCSYDIPNQQPFSTNMNYANNYQQQRNIRSARANPTYNRYNNINNSSTTNLLNQLQDEAYQQEQITIIPQPNSKNNVSTNYLEAQKQQLKNEWIQQIEDKKRRKEIEKQKEIEKDREAEERWKKQMAYQEEIKQNMKQGKFKLDNFAPSPGNEFAMMTYINNPNNEVNQNNINDNNSSPQEMNQGMSPEFSNQDNNINNNNNNSDMVQSQQNMNYPNSGMPKYNPYDPKENDVTMKLLEFSKLSRRLDDNINDQLSRLRNDVNNQYLEMSNLFGKLKQDVAEANQLKNDAERELNYVKDELMKQKMNNILYENKLNQTLERHAPYNNLHIPYSEVNPVNNNVSVSGSLNQNKNLQSVSTHLYMNDMINEGNINQARELSSMAKLGQSLMNVSELVPIVSSQQLNEGKVNNDTGNANMNGLPSEQVSIGFNHGGNEEEVKVMDEYQNNMSSDFKEMNNALEQIELLNQQLNFDSNVNTINNNLDLELSIKKHDRQHQEEIKAMDDKLYHNK